MNRIAILIDGNNFYKGCQLNFNRTDVDFGKLGLKLCQSVNGELLRIYYYNAHVSKTIDPLGVECEVRVRSRRSRDIFDDFFNDSIFGRTMRHAVLSPAVSIEVLPLPEEGKPSDFSGVVGSYTLNATVDKSSVKTNEAISYKINIEGQGNHETGREEKGRRARLRWTLNRRGRD